MTGEDAKKAILKLFQCYNLTGSDIERKIKFTIYWDVLGNELCHDAIVKVCQKALAGYVGDPKWLPTPGMLIKYAKENYIQLEPIRRDPRLYLPPSSRFPDSVNDPAMPGWKREQSKELMHELATLEPLTAVGARHLSELRSRYDEKALPLVREELLEKLGCTMPKETTE
jgi:hypothetical protein